MKAIIAILIIWYISALIRTFKKTKLDQAKRIVALECEQEKQAKEQEKLAKEQEKQAKEQEKLEKEQAKQAEVLRKHEERLMKLEQRMATAESEIAFNREQRERLFKLLDIEERERDGCIEGSATWQKHHKKIISLENQIHTVEKRIDKAHMEKAYCEKQMEAA